MNKRSLIIAAIVLAFAGGAQAATLTVTNTSDGPAPGPDGSLRKAISDAASGDTIQFALPSNSTVALTSGELLIEKNLTISGPGANRLSVQRSTAPGTLSFRILSIEGISNVTLSGLKIANGDVGSGGGIYNDGGTVTITNSTISANRAGNGGGIYNDAGTVTISNSTISGNSAGTDGGGIYNDGGTVTISNSTISGNSTGFFGGGIYNDGTMTITNSTISGNSSGSTGGGIRGIGDTLTARNTIIAGNTMATYPDVDGVLTSQGYNLIGNTSGTTITGTTTGNQLNVDPKLGPLQDNGGPTFTHALLSGSTAIEGGNSGGSSNDQRGFARPVDSPAFANSSDGSDIGACEVQADLLPGCNTIDRVVRNNNDSGDGSLRAVIASVCAGSTITFAANVRGVINLTGGELLINKTLTISGPGAQLLSVQRSAAAGTPNFRIFSIQSASVIVTITGLTITNGNADTNAGGGIQILGSTVNVHNSTISGNSARTGGGGIYNFQGTVTVTYSTISGNTLSAGHGGGIYNGGFSSATGTLTITSSTISGNEANGGGGGGWGGGINNAGGTVTVMNSTISGNTSQLRGGGINNSNSGTLTITNSTISGNRALAENGGGVHNVGGAMRAGNTLIALNTGVSGPDMNGALTSEGFNLIGNYSGATIAPAQLSDQIGVTAAQLSLGPLQDNGGPTRTHALLAGSRAIDKGHSIGSPTDQRGFSRPADNPAIANADGGDGGDIGAFEFGGAAGSLKVLSITRSGNGPVVLQVAGFPYGVHRIQTSADLSFGSFIDIATATADASGRFQYQSPVAGLTNFYRVAFP